MGLGSGLKASPANGFLAMRGEPAATQKTSLAARFFCGPRFRLRRVTASARGRGHNTDSSAQSPTAHRMSIAASDLTLGLLAGGRASRLGGLDKAWLRRDGQAQVLRLAQMYRSQVAQVVVSANRDLPRFAAHGLRAVSDSTPDLGPLGGLQALAEVCATPWLFTVPVDAVAVDAGLLPALIAAHRGQGAYAIDDDGVQPLFALWPLAPLRRALSEALSRQALAVRGLQAGLGMAALRLDGLRFGNLNTPDDLAAAGFAADPLP